MQYCLDRAKPEGMNVKTWRRTLVQKYLENNPDHKPRDVLAWLKSQKPNP